MNKLTIHGSQAYKIIIDEGLRNSMVEWLKPFQFNKILIVTDQQVAPLYLANIVSQLSYDYEVYDFIIPEGESSKSLDQFEAISTFLSEHYFDRQSAIIALGGGVTGDLAGFVASSYMRGIGFVQMPTTLLAHDSSVGGKVAINLNHVKNIIGHFYSPNVILYDYGMFASLSSKQFRSGFAEVIKHSYLKPDPLYQTIKQVDQLSKLKKDDIEAILSQSIAVKKAIVEQDEYEQNTRQVLNLGHTLGHAIESVYSQQAVTHGESVIIGILFDLFLSDCVHERRSPLFHDELLQWLTSLGYSLAISDWPTELLIESMKHDKKNQDGEVTCILLESLGKPYAKSFSVIELEMRLEEFIRTLNQYQNLSVLI